MSSKKFILNSTLLISLKHLKIPKVVLNKKWRSLIWTGNWWSIRPVFRLIEGHTDYNGSDAYS